MGKNCLAEQSGKFMWKLSSDEAARKQKVQVVIVSLKKIEVVGLHQGL